jgi:hypothetical protein
MPPALYSQRSPTEGIYRPHKRRKIEGCAQHTLSNGYPEESDDSTIEAPIPQSTSRTVSHIRNGALTYPRSIYLGWIPPMPPIPENVAISEMKVSVPN